MDIRMLTAADAPAFQALRLRALREHPEAFGAAFEEEQATPVEEVAQQLQDSSPERFILGAFLDGRLQGIVGCSHPARAKTRHRAHIWGMYVTPDAAGQGVGRALLAEAVRRTQALPGVEDVVLAVTVGNERARRLYISAGFEPYCVEPRYLKLGDRYFDLEWMILRLSQE